MNAASRGAWVSLTVASLFACNAVFGIEEGVLDDTLQGGTGGAAGSAGLGSAGSAGSGGPTSDVVIHPRALTFNARSATHPDDGLISGRLNTYSSLFGTTIEPDCEADNTCFSAQAGGEVCVRGTTMRIPNQDYDNYYGSALQIDLGNYTATPTAPWDRAQGAVRGLSFRISGTEIPSVRFNVGTPATASEEFPVYCQDLPAGQAERYEIIFDTLANPCWEPQLAQPLPEGVPFRDFVWSVTASELTDLSFDFCVGDIRPIVRAP
jgi:hypothetical protein